MIRLDRFPTPAAVTQNQGYAARFRVYWRLQSISGDCGSSISSLAKITIGYRSPRKLHFEFIDDYNCFPAPAKVQFRINWRLRPVFGDWESLLSSLTTSTIVLWHLWKLKFTDNNNHFLEARFRFTTIATDFDRKIPEPWYKFNVNLWLVEDFHDPSLKFRTFQGLLWPVDTLKMQRQIGGKQILFLYVLK